MTSAAVPTLLPARILNEHVYCPRLAYLEWVDRQFKDNADTAEGTFVHRRVDRPRSTPPGPVTPQRTAVKTCRRAPPSSSPPSASG